MKMYVYINQSFVEDFLKGDMSFCLDISSDNPKKHSVYSSAIPAGEIDIDIDIDTMQIRKAALANLSAETDKVRADMSEKLNRIETRRQNLLAIEHKGDSDE